MLEPAYHSAAKAGSPPWLSGDTGCRSEICGIKQEEIRLLIASQHCQSKKTRLMPRQINSQQRDSPYCAIFDLGLRFTDLLFPHANGLSCFFHI
jgi:hypothetical protein